MARLSQKDSGAYFTPDQVVRSLVRWAARKPSDRLLDPSCGDGRFIAAHANAVGIEQDPVSAEHARQAAPGRLVHEGDFFAWATATKERFECAAGNPPFIRYQKFSGEVRAAASKLCASLGADFSGLASSWAPFLVATASLLKPGGRMSFVVPAEIGHAPYAAPLLEYLLRRFSLVQVVAVRDKLFTELSEDCWLLHAEGFGGTTNEIRFTALDRFVPTDAPPKTYEIVPVTEWRDDWQRRLRPYLIGAAARSAYLEIARDRGSKRLGEIAQVGIGYVSGANDFFHLRPSEAARWSIPSRFLHPTIRNGRALPRSCVTPAVVEKWVRQDEPVLLLRLPKSSDLPTEVVRYLDSEHGQEAREAYKCRMRDPWFSVPDVQVPNFFLSYMSGAAASLVRNDARCTCTNSVHSVRLLSPDNARYLASWDTDLVRLSTELEGHPLGGGMLKLEPREAGRVLLANPSVSNFPPHIASEALSTMRRWRHYG